MNNVEKINIISDTISILEAHMFPVLNRVAGKSYHNELNAVEVFPGIDIPNIYRVINIEEFGDISKILCVISKDFTYVKDGQVFKITNIDYYEDYIIIPTAILNFEYKELLTCITDTYIYNLKLELDKYKNEDSYSRYNECLDSLNVYDIIKDKIIKGIR